jgi:hypothetical protein
MSNPILNFRVILQEWEEERYLRGSLHYALRLGRWASVYAALIAHRGQTGKLEHTSRRMRHCFLLPRQQSAKHVREGSYDAQSRPQSHFKDLVPTHRVEFSVTSVRRPTLPHRCQAADGHTFRVMG